jgi:hypothetical protein
MRTPPRRPRITRKAQKASQDERKTTHPDDWKQCTQTFFFWHNKSHYSEVQCGKQLDHDGHEHKAKVKGGVVRWRTKPARAAESPS